MTLLANHTIMGSAVNPLIFMPFNETSGTVATDISGRGNNGTIASNITFLNDGGEGQVFEFEGGDNSWVDVNPNITIGDKWIFTVRIYHDTFSGGTGRSIFKAFTAISGVVLFEQSGRLKLGKESNLIDGDFITAVSALPLATWYDLKVVKDGGSLYTVSINGVEGSQFDGLLELEACGPIGRNHASSFPEPFTGRMKNFKIEAL